MRTNTQNSAHTIHSHTFTHSHTQYWASERKHTYTQLHTQIHTQLHTHTIAHRHSHNCTHTHTQLHTQAHTIAQTDTHNCTHRYTPNCTHTQLHTQTHKQLDTQTHTHICIHKYTQLHTHTHFTALLWTSDQFAAEAATYTKRNRHNIRTSMHTYTLYCTPLNKRSVRSRGRYLHKAQHPCP